MAHAFDTDPLGAVLEYTGLMGGSPFQPSPAQRAWAQANLLVPDLQAWIGPAMFPSGLISKLAARRDRGEVKRKLHRVIRSAEAHGLMEPLSTDDNPQTPYRVLTPLGRELLEEGSYLEYVNGPKYIVDKWRSSVVKIFHPTDAGIGTGFLIAPNLVATARHVVEGLQEFVIEFEDGTRPTHRGFVAPDNRDIDVAIVHLEQHVPQTPFRLSDGVELLDEVVVLGYPPVPHTGDAFLVVNRGEVSADVTLRTGVQAIIVSCLLRGGNSGGPVVDRRGRVAGVVSDNLFNRLSEEDHSINEGIGFAAAVPSVWVSDLRGGMV